MAAGIYTIYSIAADQVDGTAASWWTPSSSIGPIAGIQVDLNGDVIFATASSSYPNYAYPRRIDKNTKADTPVYAGKPGIGAPGHIPQHARLHPWIIKPAIFTAFTIRLPPIAYSSSVYNIYKLKRNGDGTYTASTLLAEAQLMIDPAIEIPSYFRYPRSVGRRATASPSAPTARPFILAPGPIPTPYRCITAAPRRSRNRIPTQRACRES